MRSIVLIFLIFGLLFVGCTTTTTPPVEQSVVPNQSDALSGAVQTNQTIRGLTSDRCGSYVTFNGLTDSEESTLQDCYERKYLTEAIEKNDTSICDEIYNPYEYANCYGLIAGKLNDSSLCNRVTNILFERKSGKDDATTTDACKLVFIEKRIEYFREVPSISCSELTAGDYVDICNEYLDKIKPASGIKSLYVSDKGSKVESYIILEDSEGTTQIEDGKLTVTITSEDGKEELYRVQYNVSRSDFAVYILGEGAFAHEDIIYLIPEIDLKAVELEEDECSGYCDMVYKAEFVTDEGKMFTESEDLFVESQFITLKPISECLLLSNVKDELVDESKSYGTYKYFKISGKVTNNCSSTKDFVQVNFILYNAQGSVLKEDFTYLNPNTIPVGYTVDFEKKFQYEGTYVDIVEIPDSYNVTVET